MKWELVPSAGAHFTLTLTPGGGGCYYPHGIGEETEAQKGKNYLLKITKKPARGKAGI